MGFFSRPPVTSAGQVWAIADSPGIEVHYCVEGFMLPQESMRQYVEGEDD